MLRDLSGRAERADCQRMVFTLDPSRPRSSQVLGSRDSDREEFCERFLNQILHLRLVTGAA